MKEGRGKPDYAIGTRDEMKQDATGGLAGAPPSRRVGDRFPSPAPGRDGVPTPGAKPAVFLDRDGTIIEDLDFIDDPAKVALLPGAAQAIRRFNDAGLVTVVVSNQSGVARGLFDEATVRAVNDRLQALLNEHGARIDAFYYCPYLDGDEAVVERYRKESDWRKPGPGMLLAAVEDMGIDLTRSWMIGDARRDIEAGQKCGCRTILISGRVHLDALNRPKVHQDAPYRVTGLLEAATIVAPVSN